MSDRAATEEERAGNSRLRRFIVQEELALVASGKPSRSMLDGSDAFRAGLLNHLLYKAQINSGARWLEEEASACGTGEHGWITVTLEQLCEETLRQRDCKTIRKYLGELELVGYVGKSSRPRVNRYRVGLRKLCQDLLDRHMEMDSRKIGRQSYTFTALCSKLGLEKGSADKLLETELVLWHLDPAKVKESIPQLVADCQGTLHKDTDDFLTFIVQHLRTETSLEDVKGFMRSLVSDKAEVIQKWRASHER
jgi:hypothetical protein